MGAKMEERIRKAQMLYANIRYFIESYGHVVQTKKTGNGEEITSVEPQHESHYATPETLHSHLEAILHHASTAHGVAGVLQDEEAKADVKSMEIARMIKNLRIIRDQLLDKTHNYIIWQHHKLTEALPLKPRLIKRTRELRRGSDAEIKRAQEIIQRAHGTIRVFKEMDKEYTTTKRALREKPKTTNKK